MLARWVAYWYFARKSFIAVKTIAIVGPCANAINATHTLPQVAKRSLPSRITQANIWMHTRAMHAVWITYRREAVNARPAIKTLTALSIVLVIVEETIIEELLARCFEPSCCLDFRVVEVIIFLNVIAVFLVKGVPLRIITAWALCALILEQAASWKMKLLVVLVVNHREGWVLSTVEVDCAKVSHRPINSFAIVKKPVYFI